MARSVDAEFARFVFFGGVNTVLTYILNVLLLQVMVYTLAFTTQYVVGIGLSYVLNSLFVFRRPLEWRKALEFPLVYVVQYVFGIVLLYFLVELFHIDEVIAPAIVIVLSLPVTFLLSRTIIRGPRNEVGSRK